MMKEAALIPVGIAAWQTPRNGDFARYVEQLTGGQAHVTLDEPGRVARWSESRRPPATTSDSVLQTLAQPQQRAGQQVLPATQRTQRDTSDVQAARKAVSLVAGKVQWGVFLLVLLQVIVLVIFSKGSVTGVVMTGLVWWLVGRVKRLLDGAGTSQNPKAAAKMQAQRARLESLVAQKKKKR